MLPGDHDSGALLLPGPQVDRRYGISPMRWRWMHDPRLNFPRPIKIRQRTYWRVSDLIEWEEEAVKGFTSGA
jgi:predicted DNA-binding transcriptional regulator AlpA